MTPHRAPHKAPPTPHRAAAALRLLLAELDLRHAQEALDGSEQSRQRYARARIETVEATEHARAAITIDPAAQEIR